MLAFDHVIIVVEDLEQASAELHREHGLGSVAGGRHVGHGTVNRIVPMDDSYLELMAIADSAEAEESPLGRWVLWRQAAGGGVSALCIRTDEIGMLGRRLREEPSPMSRMRPDGVELSWRLAGLGEMLLKGLPFFIQWDMEPGDHPGRMPVTHERGVGGIAWVELGAESDEIQHRLGPHSLDIRLVDGEPGPRRVGIARPDGELVIA